MKFILIVSAAAFASMVVLSSCTKQAAEQRGGSPPTHSAQVRQILTLPSGYRLKLIQVGPIYSTATHGVLGVMLAYETDIPINNVASLAHEADGIFKYFHFDAERWGYSSAVLSPTAPPTGFIVTHNEGFRFVYERKGLGKWKRTNGPK